MRICHKCNSEMEADMMFCPECGAKYLIHDTQVYAAADCPVAIVEQNLIETEDETSIVIVFGNISDEAVNAVSVRLKCYDELEDELEDTVVKFSKMSIDSGEFFGEDKVIIPANADTSSFKIIIEKILLEDSGLIKTLFSEFEPSKVISYAQSKQEEQNDDTDIEEIVRLSEEVINKRMEIEARVQAVVKKLDELWCEYTKKYSENPNWSSEEYIAWFKRYESISEVKQLHQQLDQQAERAHKESEPLADNVPDMVIPAHIESINLSYIKKLRSVRFLGKTQLERSAFADCSALEKVVLPDGITTIPEYAFTMCKSLKEINIPDTVTCIKGGAFESNENLKELFIPDSVINIAHDAFEGCNVKLIRLSDEERQAIREAKQKEQTDKKMRIEQYWAEHSEEKARLEAEMADCRAQINNISKEIEDVKRNKIAALKEKRELPVSAEKEKEKVMNDISAVRIEMNNLGLFKRKEKKALQHKINELNSIISEINDRIEQERADQNKAIDAEIAQVEESLKPQKEKIEELQKRIAEINNEFTMDR